MYDDGTIQGFFLFAGPVLKDMNSSLWKSWDLPGHLEKEYFPYLGSATVTVTSSDNMLNETLSKVSKAAPNATAVVVFGRATHVTRKAVNADGSFTFGGWAGKKKKTPHCRRWGQQAPRQGPDIGRCAHPSSRRHQQGRTPVER